MTTFSLFVKMKAKPGKEKDVEDFLRQAQSLVKEEPGTAAWFAIKFGPQEFGIFDAFHDEDARNAHLNGKVAAALIAKASDLFAEPPTIMKADVLASKLPTIDHAQTASPQRRAG